MIEDSSRILIVRNLKKKDNDKATNYKINTDSSIL